MEKSTKNRLTERELVLFSGITPQNRLHMGHPGDQRERANQQVVRKGLSGRMGEELKPNNA